MKGKCLKRVTAAVLSAMLCCTLFAGCGKKQPIQTEMPEQGTLQVSCLVRNMDVDGTMLRLAEEEFEKQHQGWDVEIDAIQIVNEDYADRVQKLLNDMMVGEGPDVLLSTLVLCNEADVNKICRSGKLVDLTPYFDADESWSWDGYNTAVIDGLKMDGKQVLMPLSYNLPFFIADKTALGESGIDLAACKTGKGLLEQFIAYNERARADKSMPMLVDTYGYTFYRQLFDIMQMNPLDYDTGKVNWDKNTRELLELYKEFYPVDVWAEVINPRNTDDKTNWQCLVDGDFVLSGRIDYWDQQIIRLFSIENTGDAAILPVYNYDGSGISVELNQAAGILQSSENKAAAFAFIKTLLGEKAQSQSGYRKMQQGEEYSFSGSMPVCEKAITAMWDTAVKQCTNPWQISNNNTCLEKSVRFDHAPDDVLQQVIGLTHQITDCYIRNRSEAGNVTEYFEDYLKGEVSYETAFDKADNTLNIYASE